MRRPAVRYYQMLFDKLEVLRRRLQADLNAGMTGIEADARVKYYQQIYDDQVREVAELTEQGAGSSTGGRCACIYELNPLFSLYLLVQVESDRVCWNLKDLRENTVEQGCLPFEILSLEQLDALILDIHHRYPRLKAAAAGIAALVNHGVVEETNQYIGLKGLNLEEHFGAWFPFP